MKFSRRAFLKSASASLGIVAVDPLLLPQADLEKTFAEIRANAAAGIYRAAKEGSSAICVF